MTVRYWPGDAKKNKKNDFQQKLVSRKKPKNSVRPAKVRSCLFSALKDFCKNSLRTESQNLAKEKIKLLSERTRWLCDQLDHRGIDYFNHAGMNIITIPNGQISAEICEQYYLVPDNHHGGINWWKIVVMDHVQQEHLEKFLDEIDKAKITI